MTLKKIYDDDQVNSLKEDLAEEIAFSGKSRQEIADQYHRLALKLYLKGWRKELGE